MADTPENGSDVSEEQKREAVRQAVIRAKERQIITVLQLCTRNDSSDLPEASASAIAVRSRPRTS